MSIWFRPGRRFLFNCNLAVSKLKNASAAAATRVQDYFREEHKTSRGIALLLFLLGIVITFVVNIKSNEISARRAEENLNYDSLSLGSVSLRVAPRLLNDPPNTINVRAQLLVYASNIRFTNVTFHIGGAIIPKHEDGDLSALLNKDDQSPVIVDFTLAAPFPKKSMVTCLNMVHPRLQTPFRVTQEFTPVYSDSGDLIDLVEAQRHVGPTDDGSPCRATNIRH
jgi:hypothetical protein